MTNIAIMSVSSLIMIFGQLAYSKHSVHEDPSWRGDRFPVNEEVSRDLFLDWCRASSCDENMKRHLIYLLISSSLQDECVHLSRMMIHFNCYLIVKKKTTVVKSETCGQARFFWDSRLDEFLCHLIFKVSCSLAPYDVKIGYDLRILLTSTESERSGSQIRIRWLRCERVRQQNISRQIWSYRVESRDVPVDVLHLRCVSFESKIKKERESESHVHCQI